MHQLPERTGRSRPRENVRTDPRGAGVAFGAREKSRVLPGPQMITGRRSPAFRQFLAFFLMQRTTQRCRSRSGNHDLRRINIPREYFYGEIDLGRSMSRFRSRRPWNGLPAAPLAGAPTAASGDWIAGATGSQRPRRRPLRRLEWPSRFRGYPPGEGPSGDGVSRPRDGAVVMSSAVRVASGARLSCRIPVTASGHLGNPG